MRRLLWWLGFVACSAFAPTTVWGDDGLAYRCDRSPIASGVVRDWFMTNVKMALARGDAAEREQALLKVMAGAKDENEKSVAGWALGRAYLQAGRDDEAAATLQPVLNATDSPLSIVALAETRVGLARVAMRKKDYARASDLLQPIAISECPLFPRETNYILADALLQQKRGREALAALDAAGYPPPSDAEYWLGVKTELHCKSDGPAACIDRIAERVKNLELSPALAEVFNTLLAAAVKDPAAAEALAHGRQEGLIDANNKVVAQPNHVLQELVPIERVAPLYPGGALRARIEGVLWAEVRIGADGKVLGAEIVYARPRRVFDEVTLSALKQWTFQPKVIDGRPVESRGLQEFEFKMK